MLFYLPFFIAENVLEYGQLHLYKMKNKFIGRLSVNTKGTGFVAWPEEEVAALAAAGKPEPADLQIDNRDLKGALHGDEVEVEHTGENKWGKPAGKVVAIVKRVKTQFVCTLEQEGKMFFGVPDDRRMYKDILIHPAEAAKAKLGEKVVVEIKDWTDPAKNPEGVIVKVLGAKGDNNAEMYSIVYEKGFETDFPPEVEAEAEMLEKTEKPIKAEEIAGRRDFRDTLTMTIDPVDAKDFDDAISFKKLEGADAGWYEIGVHIADVSHYVRPGTKLDEEAQKRGFSVYLVDRTIPMLPEVLSNDICSLNPHEDKLAFSAVFVINDKAEIRDRWFGKTIINSDRRFTYEDAQFSIVKGGDYENELRKLNEIAKVMQKEKFEAGAINFEQDEIKFRLDQNGKPLEVIIKQRFDAHKLVEEYMLLANREVAEYLYKIDTKKTDNAGLMYRIHDVPNPEKIANLVVLLKALGYTLPVSKNGSVSAKDMNALLNQVAGKAEEGLVKTAAVRSMSKAIYSTHNIGHFGLSFEYYTHFTSPIRRYPDLLVHRILHTYLQGKDVTAKDLAFFTKMAASSTDREIAAADAERTSVKYKMVEFMQDRVGQEFEGVISGVSDWGIYVEAKETHAEGMVSTRTMNDDDYELSEKEYALVGKKTKKKYQLGDTVRVKLVGADMERRAIDYVLV